MDVQRKKGILEVCVLAVLKKGPSYGYMIIRELEQCVEISESTLYPILKRLEQNGSLKTYRQEYNGRMRKYYRLTEEGQQKIDVFLDEWDELRQMYRFVEEQNQMAAEAEEPEEVKTAAPAAETVAAEGATAETEEPEEARAAAPMVKTEEIEEAPATEEVKAVAPTAETEEPEEATAAAPAAGAAEERGCDISAERTPDQTEENVNEEEEEA